MIYVCYFKMELYTALCALVVSSVFRGALTCEGTMRILDRTSFKLRPVLGFYVPLTTGKDVWDISERLAGVPNWKGLADLMNINSHNIEANCALDIAHAACYRRQLVRSYCDSQPSGNPYKVAEDIAQALEKMDHQHQAEQLRKLEFGKLVAKRNSTPVAGLPHTHATISEHWLVYKMDTNGCV